MTITIRHGDCLATMAELPDHSIDAIVTDPPYGLGFMGKAWDALPPGEEWARECLRVLKPGGHLLAFGGTRTWHRLAVAVEDAGFEIRDSIAWLYGSGFPKSLDVSKAIDKAAGAERPIIETIPDRWAGKGNVLQRSTQAEAESVNITAPATDAAREWQGWGTAMKPAHEPVVWGTKPARRDEGARAFEPIVMARKPLTKGNTVAANVLTHGTGAINVDACRIGDEVPPAQTAGQATIGTFERGVMITPERAGRWPANVALDEPMAAELDNLAPRRTDTGGASRFFYVAKAPKTERPVVDGVAHPTVKPLTLMRWLVRLATPPGGIVLDPFAGSGTTIEAAMLEGFNVVGIEREAEYLPLIQARIDRNQVDDDLEDPRYGINPPPASDGGLFEMPS